MTKSHPPPSLKPKHPRVTIIGLGFVGTAVYHMLKNCDVVIHDPPKGYKQLSVVIDNSDFIFICLPTPTVDGIQDDGLIWSCLDRLKEIYYEGVVIIKSTMLNPPAWVVYNPEFLNENSSVKDCLEQQLIILGGNADATKKVKQFYLNNTLIYDPLFHICTIKEAVNIKYYHNIYNAYKILFWNYVNERCDHRSIATIYKKLRKNKDNEFSQVAADGTKGFGGACFPKDIEAFNTEHPHLLTEFMIEYNKKLRP